MSLLVTQCPNCGASFNVTSEILETAAGQVRCGACLRVFNAEECLVTDLDAEKVEVDSVFVGTALLQQREETDSETVTSAQAEQLDLETDPDSFTETDDSQDVNSHLHNGTAFELTPGQHPANSERVNSHFESKKSAPSPRGGKQLLWTALSVVLALLLFAQFLVNEFESLSQSVYLRPVFFRVCSILECEQSALRNIAAIRSEEVRVENHPEFDNGLLIDVEFRNTAEFPQPFPILILSFRNNSNQVIALREFAPEEYLDGAELTADAFAPRTSLQANLAIVEPGAEAVQLNLAFRFQ